MKKSLAKDLTRLAREMELTTSILDGLPDGTEYDAAELATLDDVRHAAMRLSAASEAVIRDAQGR